MTTTFASEATAGERTTMVLNDAIVRGGTTDPAGTGGYSPAAGQAQQPHLAPRPAADDRGRTFAITSFVLGILSVVSGWTFIAPIIGLVLGVLALRRNTSERTLALWGVWTSGVMLALSVIAVAFGAMFLGLGFLAAPFIG